MDNGQPAPFLWVEESSGDLFDFGRKKRKAKSKKMQFIGWGSKPLIEFLGFIGKDTSKALSQDDVTAIINKYIKQNNLVDPVKKKKVLCDDRLSALFRRKSVSRLKIYQLLESHFTENHVESDDEIFYSSEDQDEDMLRRRKEQKVSSDKKPNNKKKAPEALKSSLAAINPENMKLVYLKRSLILDLLKDWATTESKLIGSFVRIKSDPLDYLQKNSHQLHLVTGIKKASDAGESNSEVLLEVANIPEDVHVSKLSDESFSEEECEDLLKRMKDGLLKQPTVGQLEQQAHILHEDITNHWIVRELSILRNLIDRANEKGWRGELAEYRERRRLLQMPEEKLRLLQEFPKVTAEETKLETLADSPDDMNEATDISARSFDWEPVLKAAAVKLNNTSSNPDVKESSKTEIESIGVMEPPTSEENKMEKAAEMDIGQIVSNGQMEPSVPKENNIEKVAEMGMRQRESSGQFEPDAPKEKNIEKLAENVKQPVIIELSDDDDDDKDGNADGNLNNVLPEHTVWYYLDPQDEVQGPFSMISLKSWRDHGYFTPDFKVWKTGQTQEESVLLCDILRQVFPIELNK